GSGHSDSPRAGVGVLERSGVARPFHRRTGGIGGGSIGGERGHPPNRRYHAAGKAVGGGARAAPKNQEPLRPRGDQHSIPPPDAAFRRGQPAQDARDSTGRSASRSMSLQLYN